MTDQDPTTSQKVANVVALTAMMTALVWWQEEDLVASPVTFVVLPAFVVGAILLARFSRTRADRAVARENAGAGRRSRSWAEVPAQQRHRFWISLGSSLLFLLLIAPLVVIGISERKGGAPLVLLVVLACAGLLSPVWVWWSVRHPTELTAAREQRRNWSVGRSLATLGIFVVGVTVARGAYRLVDLEPLSIVAAATVSAAASVLMVTVTVRLARRPVAEKQPW